MIMLTLSLLSVNESAPFNSTVIRNTLFAQQQGLIWTFRGNVSDQSVPFLPKNTPAGHPPSTAPTFLFWQQNEVVEETNVFAHLKQNELRAKTQKKTACLFKEQIV